MDDVRTYYINAENKERELIKALCYNAFLKMVSVEFESQVSSQNPEGKFFPESPEEKFDAVVAALQTPPKQALMLLLRDYPQTGGELGKLLRGTIATQESWTPGRLTALCNAYCRQSFIPIGMVAEETFIPSGGTEESVGFVALEAGIKYGQPLAAFSLIRSFQDCQNGLKYLWPALGKTASSGLNRPPATRARILRVLSRFQDREISIPELLSLGEFKNIHRNQLGLNIKALASFGLIRFDSVYSDKGAWLAYRLNTKEVELDVQLLHKLIVDTQHHTSIPRVKEVVTILQNSPDYLKINDLVDKSGMNRRGVNNTLYILIKAGYVERTKLYGTDLEAQNSKVILTESGQRFANDLLTMFDAVSDGESLNTMRANAQQLIGRPTLLREIVSRAIPEWLPYSHVMYQPSLEAKNKIMELFGEKDEIRPVDLKDYGLPTKYLLDLAREGLVMREQRGMRTYYRIAK